MLPHLITALLWLLGLLSTESLSAVSAPLPADISDIRTLLPEPSLPPLFLTGGLLVCFVALYLLQRKKLSPAPSLPAGQPTPGHSPHDLLALLSADYRQGLCPPDRLVLDLDCLLRGALTASGLPAEHLTTGELLRQAATWRYRDDGQLQVLHGFLHLADLVKFAGYLPGTEQAERALSDVGRLLETIRTDP